MKKFTFLFAALFAALTMSATEVTVSIADYATANGWENSKQYTSLTMDEVVTVTANPTTGTYNNTGKYYTNGNNWRMYQNEAPAIVVTAAEGYQLTSVTFAYASEKTGVMVDADGAHVASSEVYALDKVASATFSVNNTKSDVTNGQARITAITVTYEAAAVEEPVEIVGVVKRAIQLGESVVVLTHEADGTPHIYNVVGEEIAEVSQEGVIARDPENAGDLLAISDIAATEDGKLVAVNYMICQSDDSYVDEGYKRGESRFYIWNTLTEAPTVWFTSNLYGNWFRSKQGYTMALRGTSQNAEIVLTSLHATKYWARYTCYKVADGVHTDNYWFEGTLATTLDENVCGSAYELNASPLSAANWIMDGELADPIEYLDAEANAGKMDFYPELKSLSIDLGKKFNGATYLTVDKKAIMVAPYANEEGLLAGVKVLDITAGLDAAEELLAVNLEAPVTATAAATAVAVAENTLTITLVADAAIHTLTAVLEIEPEIEWIPMELEITNLTTEVMEAEGAKYLLLQGRDDMNDADVMIFLKNYADVDDDYTVDAENSYMTFGGMEMTVIDGVMTQTSETDKGTLYTGTVRASVEEEGMTMYVEFALTMYAAPAIVIELTDAIVAINEELGTLTFNVPTEEGGYYAELAGYTAPGVHEGPQICLFETPEAVAFANYVETSVADGVITLKGEFTSFMGAKFDVTISGKLPVEEPEVVEPTYTENKLNTYAFGLESKLTASALEVTYRLNNSNATSVNVLVYNGEEVVATVAGTTTIGKNIVEVATADLPAGVQLTWAVEVNGTSVEAPTQEAKIYSFYHPSGMDIDNNPENATFGMLLINEGMHSVKDKTEGYVSAQFGAGIFAFTPSFDLIPNGELPGYNGGIEFTTTRADGTGTAYSPRRIRISEDGRIFVTSLNTDGNYLWEVNPANMNEWTSVFQGTLNDNKELITADSAFIAAPNNGFDVKGAGENLQLAMYSVNLPGITSAAMSGFRLHEYNLGTATEWATAPSKALVEGKYAINYTGTQVEYDNEGGFWIASYRGTASDANPGLVHINADGVEDAKLIWSNVRQAGIRFNNDFTKLVVAGNNGTAKKATIYTISKDANGAPVLTEEAVVDMAAVGNNLNDFAWDYAGNLYACGNSAEKLIGWAMPYSGKVVTPAASKYAFELAGPVEIVGTVKRAVQNGQEVIVLTHEADGTAHIYQVANGEVVAEVSQEGVIARDPENAGDLLAISDIAVTEDGKLVASNKIVCQSEGYVDEGYKRGEFRAYIWNDLAGAPSILLTSKMSSNWFRSVQGHTIGYKGTSTNGTLFTTGVTATAVKFRYSVYNIIDGVYTDPAVNDSEHYHFTKGSAYATDVVGANYEIVASPFGANNWIFDADMINPFEFVDPLTYNTEVTEGAKLSEELGKKYNGASYVTVGEQVLMVAPYATAEGLLAGVKVLDITAGLASATEVAVVDLDAAVEATAAATAVAVNENVLTITLVADATLHTLVAELPVATSGTTLTATGLETKLESDGSYTLQGLAVVNGDENNLMDFMLCVYPTEGYTDAFLNGWSVMIFGAPTPDAFVENEDGTFTYTAKIEDTYGDGTIYNINMSGTIKKTEGPEYMELDDQITNLTIDLENMLLIGGPSENFEIEVVLGLGEDNFDGTFTLSSESSVSIRGTDAEFVEGYVYDIDLSAPSATAVVKVNWDGMYYAFTLTMTAAPAEATKVVVENATVEVEKHLLFGDTYDYSLKMTGNWTNEADGITYPVLVEVPVYYPEATEPFSILSTVTVGGMGDNDPWLGFGEGELTVTTVDGVVTATGVVSNWDGLVIDITISGKLPQDPGTGIEDVEVEVKAVKVIKNGQLIISKDGKEYNAQGATVK